jgi:molecular chaperone DnaK
MKKDAETHAEEDKKKKESVEARNVAESLVSSTEKALKEAGEKISEDKRKPVVDKMEALKKVLENKEADAEEIKKSTEEFSTEAQKIGEELYKAAQPAEGATPEGAPGADEAQGTEEAPKEAETEEKKDEESQSSADDGTGKEASSDEAGDKKEEDPSKAETEKK